MKKIPTKKGEEISTPWLSTDEAAVYCNMSRGYFLTQTKGVPRAGGVGKPKYHIDVLDEWMKTSYNVASLTGVPEG